MPPEVIKTARLTLRRARADDAPALHALFIREEAMRYWSTPPHESLAQTRVWLDRMIAAPRGTSDDFIVEYQGQVIGKAGAWCLPEVGFILHPDHWRKGLAREAMTAVITHLFDRHDLKALTAETDPRNIASNRLLLQLGFEVTGYAAQTLQWRDEWCDSLYFALPRSNVGVE